MNSLQIFENKNLGKLRTIIKKEEIFFVATDVAKILGYANTKDVILMHVDEKDKFLLQRSENATFEMPNRGLIMINESGFYSLVLASKKPNAKKFKNWVTSKVLPEIRQKGYYSNEKNEKISNLELLKIAVKELEEKTKKIEELEPKAEFYDLVSDSKDNLNFFEFSKLINKKYYLNLGRTKLFELLRNKNILNRNNIPYQQFIEKNLFEVSEKIYKTSKMVYLQTEITAKGQQFLVRKLKEWNYIN